jgi:signal peptidase II
MEDATARRSRPWPRLRFAARPRDAWFLLLAAAIVGLDQLTKGIIRATVERGDSHFDLGVVRIVHILNTGAAFGMLQNAGPLLAVTSVVGMAAILIYLFNPGFAHPLMRLGLALMLGGAVGNLIDRVRTGEVVDFIKVPNWPAFNAADSAITIGVLLLIWGMLRDPGEETSNVESS